MKYINHLEFNNAHSKIVSITKVYRIARAVKTLYHSTAIKWNANPHGLELRVNLDFAFFYYHRTSGFRFRRQFRVKKEMGLTR